MPGFVMDQPHEKLAVQRLENEKRHRVRAHQARLRENDPERIRSRALCAESRRWQLSASFPKATTRCHSVRSCRSPLRSVNRALVATEKFATF
jgi:hypothetical protein